MSLAKTQPRTSTRRRRFGIAAFLVASVLVASVVVLVKTGGADRSLQTPGAANGNGSPVRWTADRVTIALWNLGFDVELPAWYLEKMIRETIVPDSHWE